MGKKKKLFLEPAATRGDGDCAFHAIFGEDNGNDYYCDNVNERRTTLKNKILEILFNDDLKTTLWPLVREAIRERILQGNSLNESVLSIRKKYNDAITGDQTPQDFWGPIETSIQKIPKLVKFLNDNPGKQIREKIHHCLNNSSDTVKAKFFSLCPSDLKKKLENTPIKSFNWEEALGLNKKEVKSILKAYAECLSKPREWLLIVEIKILAFVFNVNISFYNTGIDNKIFHQSTFKSNGRSEHNVAIRFDGKDHYERLLDKKRKHKRKREEMKEEEDSPQLKRLNTEDDPKIKGTNLPIKLFIRLKDQLEQNKQEIQEKNNNIISDILTVNEKTGHIEVKIEKLNRTSIQLNNSTIDNFLTRIPLVALLGGLINFSPPMMLLGAVWIPYRNYCANKFSESLNKALIELKNNNFMGAEGILANELGKINASRLRGLIFDLHEKIIVGPSLQKNEYPIAHFIRGQCAIQTKSENVYIHFMNAYSQATDDTLKGLSLMGIITALSQASEIKLNGLDGKAMEEKQIKTLIKDKLSELYCQYEFILDDFYQKMSEFCLSTLDEINNHNFTSESVIQCADSKNILHFENIALLKKMLSISKNRTLVISFVFLQGVMQLLRYKQDTNIQFISSAKQKFEDCWKLIQLYQFSEDDEEWKLTEQIRTFIIEFAEDVQVNGKDIFKNQDMNEWLIKLEIRFVPNWDKLLPLKEFFIMANRCNKLYLSTRLKSLDDILNKIKDDSTFAASKLEGNNNWFHMLAQLPEQKDLTEKLLIQAIQKLACLNISPYEKNIKGYTAFYYLKKHNDPDPNKLNFCFRDANGKIDISITEEPKFLIGVENIATRMIEFFNNVKDNPHKNEHFLLLAGPPGLGKTELTNYVAKKCRFEIREYKNGDEADGVVGGLETRIQTYFQDAKKSENDVCLFIDEIDAVVPEMKGKPQAGYHNYRSQVTVIQKEINDLRGYRVVLVGATNYQENLEPAINDRATNNIIFFKNLNTEQRLKILKDFFSAYKLESSNILAKVAEATSGWSTRTLVSYIESVCNKNKDHNSILGMKNFVEGFEVCREACKRKYSKLKLDIDPPKLCAENEDAFKELVLNDVANKLSSTMRDFLNDPQKYFKKIPAAKINCLLYGPPGTGKTSFARAIAQTSNAMFINIRENHAHQLEKIFILARQFEKVIIFLDEIDKIGGRASPWKESLQTEMDGFHKNKNALVIIGATNKVDTLAEPIVQRFTDFIEMSLPDSPKMYQRIFENHIQRNNIKTNSDFNKNLPTLVKWAFDQKISPRVIDSCINAEAMDLIYKKKRSNIDSFFKVKKLKKRIEDRTTNIQKGMNTDYLANSNDLSNQFRMST